MRKFLFILSIGYFFCLSAYAQTKTVTSKVSAVSDGLSLPGVSVIIKGTTTGTITGLDGKFSLLAAPNDVLVFSYIGFATQEIKAGSRPVHNISLSRPTSF